VRPVGGDRAQRRGADAVGVLPLAGGDQRFDMLDAERAVLDAVRLDGSDPLRRQTGRIPGPPQHRQHVGGQAYARSRSSGARVSAANRSVCCARVGATKARSRRDANSGEKRKDLQMRLDSESGGREGERGAASQVAFVVELVIVRDW
jgi:hypothetical protein